MRRSTGESPWRLELSRSRSGDRASLWGSRGTGKSTGLVAFDARGSTGVPAIGSPPSYVPRSASTLRAVGQVWLLHRASSALPRGPAPALRRDHARPCSASRRFRRAQRRPTLAADLGGPSDAHPWPQISTGPATPTPGRRSRRAQRLPPLPAPVFPLASPGFHRFSRAPSALPSPAAPGSSSERPRTWRHRPCRAAPVTPAPALLLLLPHGRRRVPASPASARPPRCCSTEGVAPLGWRSWVGALQGTESGRAGAGMCGRAAVGRSVVAGMVAAPEMDEGSGGSRRRTGGCGCCTKKNKASDAGHRSEVAKNLGRLRDGDPNQSVWSSRGNHVLALLAVEHHDLRQRLLRRTLSPSSNRAGAAMASCSPGARATLHRARPVAVVPSVVGVAAFCATPR